MPVPLGLVRSTPLTRSSAYLSHVYDIPVPHGPSSTADPFTMGLCVSDSSHKLFSSLSGHDRRRSVYRAPRLKPERQREWECPSSSCPRSGSEGTPLTLSLSTSLKASRGLSIFRLVSHLGVLPQFHVRNHTRSFF